MLPIIDAMIVEHVRLQIAFSICLPTLKVITGSRKISLTQMFILQSQPVVKYTSSEKGDFSNDFIIPK